MSLLQRAQSLLRGANVAGLQILADLVDGLRKGTVRIALAGGLRE